MPVLIPEASDRTTSRLETTDVTGQQATTAVMGVLLEAVDAAERDGVDGNGIGN
ncbi:hypothetical protein OB955_04170 [Halobacteria archaeon AArc-m2/3/4]|uniref:Uncharacterized protein n=1 Tax=Natronoglomus mannanivorans TaxID=2979990 RepID=A0AAP2Z029_9EURY|nr:hypothetical protein [Halobacteria archaeon AArc-xg1-1]MCU4971933.1 hypothetical protein [Halobacteria archaeon AArc-m2/3/4]